MVLYYSQSGDTLPAVASRFGVELAEIKSDAALPASGLLTPRTLLIIPDRLSEGTAGELIMPDSEVVYSPAGMDFDTGAYVAGAGGYLYTYGQYLASTGWTSGSQAVERIAEENSINPRLLLALIEYTSGWVHGQPADAAKVTYPLGKVHYYYRGLFRQMMWAVQELSQGYYDWRSGELLTLTFPDGASVRLSPELNAGSAALLYFFSIQYDYAEWLEVINAKTGFPALYRQMFGDPWIRAAQVEPLFPPGLTIPSLSLPFAPGQVWSLTGGPHAAWEMRGALAALDFSPGLTEGGCAESNYWVLASAPGLVVRSGSGLIVLDLDGDGHEQTGWVLLFLHLATDDRVSLGDWINADDPLGHPSCEGGVATGPHIHMARKYNGEWVLADGPLPFTLSGWVAHAGNQPYEGTLTKDDKVVIAMQNGLKESNIVRSSDE